ncbi:MAG: MFS transporter [Ardenticatenaceae bacterium]|nr:MFS transporter [Ardenticatenaceae bacterium]
MIATATASSHRPQLSSFRQFLLAFFWFAFSVHWTAILIVTLPAQALLIGGDEVKGRVLGIVLLAGAFISMVVAPIIGALSDRVRLPLGRRRPWMIGGTLLNVVGLLGMAYIPRQGDMSTLIPFILAFMVVEFANNVASAPYAALIPDVVAPEQRGAASGWMGLMTMVGNALGAVLGLLITVVGGITGIYWIIIAVMLVGVAVTAVGVSEPPAPAVAPFTWRGFLRGLWLDPRQYPDFAWVFLTRLLIFMGVYTVQEFLQFYMKDVIGAPFILFGARVATLPEEAVSFFLLTLLLGALVSSLTAGTLSDRLGRKRPVYASSALMGGVAAIFVFYGNFELAVLLGVIFGLGYGAYTAVDWALATDVLPSMDDYAKDMGIWHIASVLPQVVATPVAGFLLDRFQLIGRSNGQSNLGYQVIFGVAVLYFMLGTVFVKNIRGVR